MPRKNDKPSFINEGLLLSCAIVLTVQHYRLKSPTGCKYGTLPEAETDVYLPSTCKFPKRCVRPSPQHIYRRQNLDPDSDEGRGALKSSVGRVGAFS